MKCADKESYCLLFESKRCIIDSNSEGKILEMKTISDKLKDSIEKNNSFKIKASLPDVHTNHNSQLEAFARLEACRKAVAEPIDYAAEREEEMNEKYGIID